VRPLIGDPDQLGLLLLGQAQQDPTLAHAAPDTRSTSGARGRQGHTELDSAMIVDIVFSIPATKRTEVERYGLAASPFPLSSRCSSALFGWHSTTAALAGTRARAAQR
jgi:hypothetical protein